MGKFNELIENIKKVETALEKKYKKPEEIIHILRGIYYRTTWSVDYSVEQSEVRNAMFNNYTYSKMPDDPRKLIGNDLYNTLFKSAEITESNLKGFDFGHAIIGLDARNSFLARETAYPLHGGGSGLEICTWLGDLGGGAGMLSIKRISDPKHKAINMFKGSSFGGWINIEGNIAGYLIARDIQKEDNTPSLYFPNNTKLSAATEQYLLNTMNNNEWNNRGKIFLKMLGGQIDETTNKLKNESELSLSISSKIVKFAEIYMTNRLRQNNTLTNERVLEASCHLVGASKEITSILLNTLTNTLGKKDYNLVAILNPDPTPKGEPFKKYSAIQKAKEEAKELIEELDDIFEKLKK